MARTKISRRYNCKRDLPDYRDHKYPCTLASHPTHVDLRLQCPLVMDQMNEGSCTANAASALLGFLQLRPNPTELKKEYIPFSRNFIYYNERLLEDHVMDDVGATVRDAVKACAKWGACDEETWIYSEDTLFVEPTSGAYLEAIDHKITTYQRIYDLQQVKTCLAGGYPVIFGFSVYESFEDTGSDGSVWMPKETEGLIGGHCVLAVGYDSRYQRMICQNSWGTGWGEKGFFYLPYSYFQQGLVFDMWTIRK